MNTFFTDDEVRTRVYTLLLTIADFDLAIVRGGRSKLSFTALERSGSNLCVKCHLTTRVYAYKGQMAVESVGDDGSIAVRFRFPKTPDDKPAQMPVLASASELSELADHEQRTLKIFGSAMDIKQTKTGFSLVGRDLSNGQVLCKATAAQKQ